MPNRRGPRWSISVYLGKQKIMWFVDTVIYCGDCASLCNHTPDVRSSTASTTHLFTIDRIHQSLHSSLHERPKTSIAPLISSRSTGNINRSIHLFTNDRKHQSLHSSLHERPETSIAPFISSRATENINRSIHLFTSDRKHQSLHSSLHERPEI